MTATLIFHLLLMAQGAWSAGERGRVQLPLERDLHMSSGLCFNQLQMLATHNSYHISPRPDLVQRIISNPFVKALLPKSAFIPQAWEYTHLPLDQQLDLGVRGFELDLHADPQGGTYAQSAGLRLAGVDGFLDDPELQEPGFKVLHVPDFDFNTTCRSFVGCLSIIKAWSDSYPEHLPITIYLESKRPIDLSATLGEGVAPIITRILSSAPAPGPDSLIVTPKLNITLLADLEDEILEVFNRSSLITPDDVRGGDPSIDIKELLLVDPLISPCPWPELDSMRGKILFVIMLGSDEEFAMYEELHPQQEGALMWLAASRRRLHQPAVFFLGADGDIPLGDSLSIPRNASDIVDLMAKTVRSAVQQGYIVRARLDADTIEPRNDFTLRRDILLAAGAHYVATDYIVPSTIFPSTYRVVAPGGTPQL